MELLRIDLAAIVPVKPCLHVGNNGLKSLSENWDR